MRRGMATLTPKVLSGPLRSYSAASGWVAGSAGDGEVGVGFGEGDALLRGQVVRARCESFGFGVLPW